MRDFSKYKEFQRTASMAAYTIESDQDILIIVPKEGMMDTPKSASENVALLYNYARSLGRPCCAVVIMDNVLSQDAEARRAYQEIDPKLVFAAGLVVRSPLARALGSFFIGLARPIAPTKLFDSVEKAIEWLRTMRTQ